MSEAGENATRPRRVPLNDARRDFVWAHKRPGEVPVSVRPAVSPKAQRTVVRTLRPKHRARLLDEWRGGKTIPAIARDEGLSTKRVSNAVRMALEERQRGGVDGETEE